ncbi:hypothetical protein PMZ80_009460 [Knufia obscura]|uniref:Uncharacterized protein n=1 Tax=Knufia obscura TaxID=1635080 RepID=A0ABR0RCX2_9EURO|nr:hypothetical protein PMZ80_009460 [Knufia obscura]
MPTHFRLRRRSQSASALLRLPAELRLKIFRNLFFKEEPIRSRREDLENDSGQTEDDYLDSLDLSSQFLRTCQQAYIEGTDILCGENILSLWIDKKVTAAGCQRQFLDVLDISICLPRSHELPRGQEVSLLDCAHTCSVVEEEVQEGKEIVIVDWLAEIYPSLARFSKFHITHRFNVHGEVVVVARMLRRLLLNKNVIYNVVTTPFYYGLLAATRVLRCRTFEFEGLEEERLEVAEHSRIITSRQPVHDTFEMWRSLHEDVLDLLPPTGDLTFESCYDEDLINIRLAAFAYDLVLFQSLQRILLKGAKEWMKSWRRWTVRQARKEKALAIARADAAIEEAKLVEAEMYDRVTRCLG